MFDHGSIAGAEGTTGIVDYFRLPKEGWYWYRYSLAKVPPPEWPKEGTAAGLTLTSSAPVIEHADGTGDVQVTVTVVDAKGAPISNTPDVTLEVVSGPGGFPTGRSITFKNGTDIPILVGQAAIEFRSYYAGTTVIRATLAGAAGGAADGGVEGRAGVCGGQVAGVCAGAVCAVYRGDADGGAGRWRTSCWTGRPMPAAWPRGISRSWPAMATTRPTGPRMRVLPCRSGGRATWKAYTT